MIIFLHSYTYINLYLHIYLTLHVYKRHVLYIYSIHVHVTVTVLETLLKIAQFLVAFLLINICLFLSYCRANDLFQTLGFSAD